ncbi:HIT domain protein [Burkholderia pseudomallei MSHR7343]|uniref:HIT family protein n=1 Tax=Burkholderia pseudomallei TaxID=28450 RepID=UPI000531E621|nr:HIT family protein [Burkholderia pseudomallei]KGS25856.1 HIT domain protein [Burkholderia pseudomallei MSHR7343]
MAYDQSNIFAKILRGEVPCIRLCETDTTLAFMDIMPQSRGHALVVPKEAAETFYELSEAAAAEAMKMAKRVALALRRTLEPEGLFIGQFNGAAAGQTVPHVHFHVIPRWADEPLKMHAREMADAAELEALAARIRTAL